MAGDARCRVETVDGKPVRVQGAGEWDDQDRAMFAEVVRAAERRVSAEVAPAMKWTERMMLDLIHQRYAAVNPGNGPRYIVAEHVRNCAGFGGYGGNPTLRTADALVIDLWPSSGHLIHGIEVKVTRSDWLTELKDPSKAEAFKPYVDHWWLAVPDASIVRDDLPDGWGLLAVGSDGKLRVRRRAPRLDREPMPFGMTAALLRAAVKTATTRGADDAD